MKQALESGRCCEEHESLGFDTSKSSIDGLACRVDGGEVPGHVCCEYVGPNALSWLSCVSCGGTEHGPCWCAQRLPGKESEVIDWIDKDASQADS